MDSHGSISRESVIILAIIGIAIILVVWLMVLPVLSPKTTPIPAQKLSQSASKDIQDIKYIPPDSPLSQDDLSQPGALYFNEKLFNQNSKAFSKQPNTIQSHRFQGVITAVDRSNGLVFHISSTMSNSLGLDLIYGYPTSALSKITVQNGTIDTLKIGEDVYIDETYDYSKPYPDSLQTVLIHSAK